MKKLPRKKALETFSSEKKRPIAKQSAPLVVDLSTVRTTYLQKGTRWVLVDAPESLNGFTVESYIEPANTLFLSKN